MGSTCGNTEVTKARIGKGKHGNGTGTGHGAEAEDIGSDKGADQCGQGAYQAEEQPDDGNHNAVGDDIAGGGDGKGNGQHRADEGAEEGHLDGIPQGSPDLGEIGGIGREHGHQNIKELAAFFYEDGEIEAGDMDRNRPQQQDDEEHEPCTAALFLHHSAAGQGVTAGIRS